MKEFVATLYFDSAENALEAATAKQSSQTPRMVAICSRLSSRPMT